MFWENDFTEWVQKLNFQTVIEDKNGYFSIHFTSPPLNIVFIPYDYEGAYTNDIQDSAQTVYLHEDVWQSKPELVKARLFSFLGLNKRIFARKTAVSKISQVELDSFLEYNHLNVNTKAKYRYGLFEKDGTLLAAASFSKKRVLSKNGKKLASYELIRFANLRGITVVGGLSKLIKHFIEEIKPDDLMTYADKEWSNGDSYLKIGFRCEQALEPQFFWVKKGEWLRYYPQRLPAPLIRLENETETNHENRLKKAGYKKIFNTGNWKYRLIIN